MSTNSSALANKKIIDLPIDAKITVTVNCFESKIPKDVKIRQATAVGTGPANQEAPADKISFSNVMIDGKGLLSRITVDSVDVVRFPGSNLCTVYIKARICTPDHKETGLNEWGTKNDDDDSYEVLVQRLFSESYKNIIYKTKGNKKVLILRNRAKGKTTEMVYFKNVT